MRQFAVLILAAALSANVCAENAADMPMKWATPVKQDANLYRLDDKLYRSEQLTRSDAAAVQSLGIKSVINLRFFDRDDNETALSGSGISLFNKPLLTWRIKPKHIAETLYLIEQRQKQGPVLIHCYHGADRTGLISGMYRVIYQNWPIEEAKREMQQGPYGYHSIWRNIANMFTEEKVAKVREELARIRQREENRSRWIKGWKYFSDGLYKSLTHF